ncbi:MAG: ABC-three component system middle component 2 [Flavobacteriales bacterium]
MKLETIKIPPFNNAVETGLRILCILNESFPLAIDLRKLVYLDYITVHSADIDSEVGSLHTPVPYRNGEILVRSSIIENGINMFVEYGLIERIYHKSGIQFKASDYSSPFIESLEEEYLIKLLERAKWVATKFSKLPFDELKQIINSRINKVNSEFNIELLQ